MSIDPSYQRVLNDLEIRRQHCLDELRMLESMISNLRQFVGVQAPSLAIHNSTVAPTLRLPQPSASSLGPTETSAPRSRIYAGMSVRWAILYLLAENAIGPMGRSEIANALEAGGIVSSAQSFASNVSAVLSGMTNERKEVEQVVAGYQITAHGREVWEGIKRTPQWNARLMPHSSS